jgi:NH3-dependent NAD+ synthetase
VGNFINPLSQFQSLVIIKLMINPNITQKTVLIGMTGGIESTVAAYLLKKQGFKVIGIALSLFNSDDDAGPFTEYNVGDLNIVKEICETYDIINYTINDDGSIDVNGDVDLHNKYLTHYPEHLREINNIYNLSQQQLENELDNIKKTQEKRDKERTEAREKEEKLFQESYELFGIKGHKET